MTDFAPFQNASQSMRIDGLTIENQGDRVSIYGSIDITKTKSGLETAQYLHKVFARIEGYLTSESLKTEVEFCPRTRKTNPFR